MPRATPQPIPTTHLDTGPNAADWAAFDRQLRAANRSPLTRRTYRQALADLANYRPGHTLTDLTKDDLTNYLADRLERLGATTVAIRYRHLRGFFNWAVREEIIDKSPMLGMSEPKVIDEPPPVISDDALRALLKACEGKTFEARRDTAIIRLFCEPGSPRVAEMAGLLVERLDMREDWIEVLGKGSKIRRIPFGAKTGTAIDRYLRLRARQRLAASPRLWLGVKGTLLTADGIGQMLHRRAAQAGIGHVHPHQLRHTAAHVWHDAGGSESEAMSLFGWRSPEMPRRYGRAAADTRAQRSARRKSLGDRL